MDTRIATGFACQPLPGGRVRIEFYDDHGETISSQVVSADLLMHLVRWLGQIITAVSLGGFN